MKLEDKDSHGAGKGHGEACGLHGSVVAQPSVRPPNSEGWGQGRGEASTSSVLMNAVGVGAGV